LSQTGAMIALTGLSSTLSTTGSQVASVSQYASTGQSSLTSTLTDAQTAMTAAASVATAASASVSSLSPVVDALSAAVSQTGSTTLATHSAIVLAQQRDAVATQAAATLSTMVGSVSSTVAALTAAPPPPPPGVPRSCRDVIRRNASAISGRYTIQPPGQLAFTAFCDNDFYGGGWTLVEKVNAGPFRDNVNPPLLQDASEFYAMTLNPTADVLPTFMANDSFPFIQTTPYYVASLNAAKTNAIGAATIVDGQSPIVRVDVKRCDGCPQSVGTWMQQLVNPPANFNYWNALRDAVFWTNATVGNAYFVVGYGDNFLLAKNPASFNPSRNVFLHDACGDRTFGHWGRFYTVVNGVNVSFSRHGGLLGDGHCNSGNLWLYTLQSDDPLGRFMNDAIRQSNVYIR